MKIKLLSLLGIIVSFTLDAQLFSNEVSILNNTSGYAPCVVDMNGDGLDDVVTFESSGGIDMHIDYQQTDGTFVGVYYDLNFSDSPSWSICAGDLDQNGYNDLMIGNGNSVSFIKANDTGTGYTEQYISDYIFSQRTNLVDIDNDGDLDAFACHDVDQSHPYRNDGNGNMTEDQSLISTVPLAGNYASIWTDFDNDGDLDMYMSKCRQGSSSGAVERENALYVNDGNGGFSEQAAAHGLFDNEQSWVTVFEDFDNDGDMDTYTVNHTVSNYLRRNDGTGHYTEVTAGSGISATDLDAWACVGADFDNDGYIDILNQSFAGKQMYMNLGDDDSIKFQSVTLPFDRGALGDLNNDGYIDVFTGNSLWINNSHLMNNNHWLKVALEGTTSNINGIGAKVEIYGPWGIQVRENRSGENFAPMSSLDVFFGLGTHSVIDSVVVKWPSGQVDKVYDPAVDQRLSIQETPFMPNLRLTRVDPSVQHVTIKNFGSAGQDISDYRLCSNINYTFSGIAAGTTVISGDLDLSPGEEVTVHWNIGGAFRTTGDDMGLYLPSGGFSSPGAMVDYMQYITLNGGREAVAVAKGIWTNDETVTGDPSYDYLGDGLQNGASFWEGQDPACDPGGAPVDLTKSFDPVNGVQDRVQVKWFKSSPQVKYTDEDAVACDIKFWKKRDLDPVTGSPVGSAYVNPDTVFINDAKKFYPDGVTPRSIFKWPIKFRADGVNNNKRAEPNIRYEWQVRCACDHGAGAESPWSAIKIFNTPDFDPATGIFSPPAIVGAGSATKSGIISAEEISLSPNPTDGFLQVSLDMDVIKRVVLIDISGRTVLEEYYGQVKGENAVLLDLTSLPSGMYLLNVQSSTAQSTQRVIKR